MAGAAIVLVPIEPPYAGTPYEAPTVAAAKGAGPPKPPTYPGAAKPVVPKVVGAAIVVGAAPSMVGAAP